MLIPKGTPKQDATIRSIVLKVPMPFKEGHVLVPNEADVMNQTLKENARNNFAPRIKALQEAGTPVTPQVMQTLQKELDAYMDSYVFGARTGGIGGQRDPVMTEALGMARTIVKKGIVKKGQKVSETSGKDITKMAKALLEKHPKRDTIFKEAQRRVDARDSAIDEIEA